MPKLAIVIPAFKQVYFQETLASIAAQSCKDFTLYIGDDASRFDLKNIVNLYDNQIEIVYKRFYKNLGSTDLVAHWERCLEMVEDEDWIWLFSDDDVMDKNCVEEFYRMISTKPSFDLYHFNVNTINSQGSIIESFPFPDQLSVEDFFYGRSVLGLRSYVVEYIFRKAHFVKIGGFENFDLAWGSDDALWIKLGKDKGIKTIPNANVCWRKSEYNISPNSKDQKILERKFRSKIVFLNWVYKQTTQQNLEITGYDILKLIKIRFLKELKIYCEDLSYKKIYQNLQEFYTAFPEMKHNRCEFLYIWFYKFYYSIIKIYRFFSNHREKV